MIVHSGRAIAVIRKEMKKSTERRIFSVKRPNPVLVFLCGCTQDSSTSERWLLHARIPTKSDLFKVRRNLRYASLLRDVDDILIEDRYLLPTLTWWDYFLLVQNDSSFSLLP
jgi:hypothetical protein